jgi:endonuclease/exonuclease/phosphatase family metal-dependent hydrolase
MLTRFTALLLAGCACLAGSLICAGCTPPEASLDAPATGPGEFLFCHWNVENFFDDHHDKRHQKADKEFDEWFSANPKVFQEKIDKLTQALLKMNDGKGPDILALCEVETVRAAEKLMEALNAKLDREHHYAHVLMKELDAGRHIAPAIITRLGVDDKKTKMLGHLQRILEGHIVVGGKELIVLATHWTSRITEGSEKGREHYAEAIYKEFTHYWDKDPHVALLVCGDFNDTPHDDSVVKLLHSSSDLKAVKDSKHEPLLYNLFAKKDAAAGFGTHYYNGKWFIFDQILVSPGMLGGSSWTCEVETAATFNSLHRPGDAQKRPWRFGEENTKGPRGYSDHFPVTVRLRLAAART